MTISPNGGDDSMKLETKSSVILIATLLLGVAIGLIGQGALQRAMHDPRGPRNGERARPSGFVARMESVLQLRVDQRATVRPLLESSADQNQRVIDDAHGRLRAQLDTLRATLAPLLDEAQRAQLADEARRLPDPFRPPPREGGRPPGDGRGLPPDDRGGPPPR